MTATRLTPVTHPRPHRAGRLEIKLVSRRPERSRQLRRAGLAAGPLLALVLASTACASSRPAQSGPLTPASPPGTAVTQGSAAALEQAYISVIRRVLPSVVEIRTGTGLGSGVVFDSAGDVVTNAHVIRDATVFQVFLAGSVTPLSAKLSAVTGRMTSR